MLAKFSGPGLQTRPFSNAPNVVILIRSSHTAPPRNGDAQALTLQEKAAGCLSPGVWGFVVCSGQVRKGDGRCDRGVSRHRRPNLRLLQTFGPAGAGRAGLGYYKHSAPLGPGEPDSATTNIRPPLGPGRGPAERPPRVAGLQMGCQSGDESTHSKMAI
jgi:hypothetical protein